MFFLSLPKPLKCRKNLLPQKTQLWSRCLILLCLLSLQPLAVRAQTEENPHDSLSLYDNYDDGAEVITFTGLEPHTYYEFIDRGGGYIAKATTNHCSMMTVKVPKKYPLASQPYSGHDSGIWNTGKLVNGTVFFWRNRPDWDNIVFTSGEDTTLPDSQVNCAYIVGRFSWFAKLKDNVLIFYAADRDIPPNSTFFVRLDGGGPVPWKFSQRKKSNACGHVAFKYYWRLTANTKKPGYDLDYADGFELRKNNVLVRNYNWADWYKWTPRPICSKGRSYLTDDDIQYD
ncbi:hypothetical protein [Synechocystis salina]|uniref:hypothetical protein n=1 Tax=Synechocystis salina TaxID=945780 RepID=UPI00188089EC|nr:hypothetical protein [Synechocystis salina]MBE9241800.1 hypothetical protein [Synechocystis salina LEGE 00041]